MSGQRERMRSLVRVRLWAKLAIFAVAGVVLAHALYLAVGVHATGRALEREQEHLGRGLARMVALAATESILVDDALTLAELVSATAAHEGVDYCLVVRGDRALASSLPAAATTALIAARDPTDLATRVVRDERGRHLEVVEPILDGRIGAVRLGLDTRGVAVVRRALGWRLAAVAGAVILASVIAAFVVGRWLARRIETLVVAADRFDPGVAAPVIVPRGRDELAELTERFNRMTARLVDAHAAQERARRNERRTETMAALGTLVAGVAHEVNNPLAGIKNCVRRLQRGDPARQTEYLELMAEGVDRIEGVMRNLLDFARTRPHALAEVVARDVVERTVALVRPALGRRRLSARGGDGDVRLLADRQQACQALLNLLLNALYVTPDGGEVRVSIPVRPGYVGLQVEDEGPGIPPELRARVFDPFFTTKPEGEGTGLGLSVTKAIIDAHGGELSLEFPGRGTVATLWFRTSDAAASTR
jgi:signal transduction histidine kinase